MIVTKTATLSAPGAVVADMDTEGKDVRRPHGDPARVGSSGSPIVPAIAEAAGHDIQRAQPPPLTSRAASTSAQQVCGPQPPTRLPALYKCSVPFFKQSAVYGPSASSSAQQVCGQRPSTHLRARYRRSRVNFSDSLRSAAQPSACA